MTRARSTPDRDALIEEYQSYARAVVARLCDVMGLPIEHFDDYLAAAYLGLVEAAERYDASGGATFRQFAFLRIRGAVIDAIRADADMSGKTYRFAKALRAVHDIREVVAEDLSTRRRENPEELLAEFLEYTARGALVYRLTGRDASLALGAIADFGANPEEAAAEREEQSRFREMVATLPERERFIVEEYYFNGKSFAEIVEESAGMSKSWVSRLHSRALHRLKERYHEALRTDRGLENSSLSSRDVPVGVS